MENETKTQKETEICQRKRERKGKKITENELNLLKPKLPANKI